MFDERLALIIDSDPRSAKTAKEALQSLCDDHIEVVPGVREAKRVVESKRVLFIFLDLDIDNEGGLNFIKWLRKNADNPNYKAPVVVVTENPAKMNAAINSGTTECLGKPFSAALLKDLIISIMRHPRNFIAAEGYTGPDRRTRNAGAKNGEKRKPH